MLAERAKFRIKHPHVLFHDLGTVVPLPFIPLSPSSRNKLRHSIQAYCSGHHLQLRAVILTPVFATATGKGRQVAKDDEITPSQLEQPSPYQRSRTDSLVEDPAGQVDSEPEMVPRGHLPRHPGPKHDFFNKPHLNSSTSEGSFVVSRIFNSQQGILLNLNWVLEGIIDRQSSCP